MGKHGPVPLIRAGLVAPVLDELNRAGALQGLLERAPLPPDLADRLGEFLPARMLLHFMAESADYLESRDLSFRAAGRARPEQLGRWGHLVVRRYTLRSALQHFCVLYPMEGPFLQMGLTEGESHAWLWRHRRLARKDAAGERQGEQHTLGSMIRVVRMVAGSQWNPLAVRIESPESKWALRTQWLAQSRVDFGGPVLAIAIPNDLLERRMPPPTPCRIANEEAGALAASDLVGSLVQALVPIATEVSLSLDLGAEIAGPTPRTLQRWLADERTSWRQIVDRVCFEASEKLMSDPSLTLTEIAMKLGYSDQAHFTRAFSRWTGEAPSVRRRRMN